MTSATFLGLLVLAIASGQQATTPGAPNPANVKLTPAAPVTAPTTLSDPQVVTVPSPEQAIEVLCMPKDKVAPPGYGAVKFILADGRAAFVCSCKEKAAYSKMLIDAVSIGGAYKLVTITHDTKRADIAKMLRRLEVPSRTATKSSRSIHRVVAGRVARRGSVAALAVAGVVVVVGYMDGDDEGEASTDPGIPVFSRKNLQKKPGLMEDPVATPYDSGIRSLLAQSRECLEPHSVTAIISTK